MPSATPLADTSDVEDVWRPLSGDDEVTRVESLIGKASARLRQKTPFDIDARIALFQQGSDDPTALDPQIVADTVATIVKRFLVNQEGFASTSEGIGPFSRSGTFVNRYDKTGQDVRGAIQVTDADIEQLRPAVPAVVASTIRTNIPCPRVVLPHGFGSRNGSPGIPVVVPDWWPDSGVE